MLPKEKELALLFISQARAKGGNWYYYPKPNSYTEVNDFALFCLQEKLTPENYKIESLYESGAIQRTLRNRLHRLLRQDEQIESKYIQKKFFYESRKLFNLSWKWQEFQAPKENLWHDLLERIELFYPYPAGINIATTNICNLSCVMCPQHSKELKHLHQNDFFKTKQFLDERVVYDAINYLAAAKNQVSTISFTAYGEATLDERLPTFIAYAKQKGIDLIYIVSNGTLLEQKGIALLDAGLNRMTISIDGATPETYYQIRHTSLERVERGVRKCIDYARKLNALGANIEFDLNCVLTDAFIQSNEKEQYLEKWKDVRDIITKIFFTRLVTYDKDGNDTNKVRLSALESNAFVCNLPWNNFMIDCYGNVSVCCTMDGSAWFSNPISIGNVIKDGGCVGVWNSKKAKQLRLENLAMNFSQFSICDRCPEKFKVCHDQNQSKTLRNELC